MSAANLTPLLPPAPARPPSEAPHSAEAEQARGPKIVPAFRFVPAAAPILADAGRLARDYARAAREAEGAFGTPQRRSPITGPVAAPGAA